MMTKSKTRVLIIGAGVSGLALAQGLQRRGIDYTVFERDSKLDSRGQGYRLKILGDTVEKLRDLITPQAWDAIEQTRAETRMGETTVNATDGSVMACRRLRPQKSMPIPYTLDRGMLRQSLVAGIGHGVIFGKSFVSYRLKDGGVEVTFEDGTREFGNLLVAADGARSGIRQQLAPHHQLIDTEACCIYGKTPLTDKLHSSYAKQYTQFLTVIQDRTPALQEVIFGATPITLVSEPVRFQRQNPHDSQLSEDYIHWGVLFPSRAFGLGPEELAQALKQRPVELSKDLTEFWHPSVRPLIDLQDPSQSSGMHITSVTAPLTAWETSARVTLMGDAAHVMSPAGGIGAATALNDAWKLATAIHENGVTVTSIGEYEAYMRANAEVGLKRTEMGGKLLQNQKPYELCKVIKS